MSKETIDHLLQESGAQWMGGKKHNKYKLPGGQTFVMAKTPSCSRSDDNALSDLRRILRPTHPELANFRPHYTPPKEIRRSDRASIGEILGLHGFGGSSPADAPEAAAALPAASAAPLPPAENEGPAEMETHHPYRAPRVPREPQPKPGPVRTLSTGQLAEFNRLSREAGEAAAGEYLKTCHLVPVTEVHERRAPPSPPALTVYQGGTMSPSPLSAMNGLIEQAQQELNRTTERIRASEARIAAEKQKIEDETERQIKLEEFVGKYRKVLELIGDSEEVIRMLPAMPIETVRAINDPPAAAAGKQRRRREENQGAYGVRDVRERVIPIFRSQDKRRFTVDDVLKVLGTFGDKRQPLRASLYAGLYAEEMRESAQWRKDKQSPGAGIFVVTPHLPEAVRLEAHA